MYSEATFIFLNLNKAKQQHFSGENTMAETQNTTTKRRSNKSLTPIQIAADLGKLPPQAVEIGRAHV